MSVESTWGTVTSQDNSSKRKKMNIYNQRHQGYIKNDFDMHTCPETIASGSKRGDRREGGIEDGDFRNEE